MRKRFFGVLMALVALATGFTANAQMPQMPQMPLDSATLYGKLPNGLTYYIRHNETPKGQADFFIAQNVGSILEDDSQRGLAHFLEHMCFNGTKNYPGNGVIDYLETVGVKFGQNLNAYTGFDETVYNISNVPVQRSGVIDSCLLVLHDWANDLTLDPEEIEKERGVIHQEWRRSSVGQMRILEQLLPKIFPGSKYGERLPIGTMEVVDNFAPQTLRDYYEKWYRPDNQAIIVVGDIDPKNIEERIKKIFADIEMPANPAPRVFEGVPDTPGTIYAIGHDKEMSSSVALIMFKQPQQMLPREYRNTQMYYPIDFTTSMVTMMLNERLRDMSQKADCPFAGASVEIGDFFVAPTKDAVTLEVVGKGNNIVPALEAAYRELLRAARGGFTVSEYERARDRYVSRYEKAYEQRAGRENTSYAREYAAHFTKNEPAPGVEVEKQIAEQYNQAPAQMVVGQLNQLLPQMISGTDNRIVLVMTPEGDNIVIPTEEGLSTLISSVEAEDIKGFEDNAKTEPLIDTLPTPIEGKVSENAQWGATEITYPNGAKVIVKKTDFKPGEILFDAVANGGAQNVSAENTTLQAMSDRNGNFILNNFAMGGYTSSDLQKYLSGKQTSLSLSVSPSTREIEGSTTPKNLKYLMELIYMSFTGLHYDAEEFAGIKSSLAGQLGQAENNPQFIFGRELMKALYESEGLRSLDAAAVGALNLDDFESTVKNLFANPAAFTFTFVGDIDVNEFVAMANQYIGTIRAPRIADVPAGNNAAWEIRPGTELIEQTTAMETPQTWVAIMVTGNEPFSVKDRIAASMAGQILSNRLLKKIREEMGAVYSIGAGAGLQRTGNNNFMLQIPFPMKPEMKDEVLVEIRKMVDGLAVEIADEEFAPIKEYMIKNAKESLEKNDSWLAGITGAQINGVDTFNTNLDAVNAITVDDVKALMKNILSQGNYRTFVLDPAK